MYTMILTNDIIMTSSLVTILLRAHEAHGIFPEHLSVSLHRYYYLTPLHLNFNGALKFLFAPMMTFGFP